jgi:competence protein ComEC
VDAGGTPGSAVDLGRRVTLPALWAFGLARLHALVITHGDPDHIGGAPAILRALSPREIWDGIPVPPHAPLRRLRERADRNSIRWTERRAGDVLRIGTTTIRVLHPPPPDWERIRVRNDDSVVLEVRIGDVAFVLPGDITQAVEPAIASAVHAAPIVVVKAPHHGSAGSSSPRFVDAARPTAVVFSAGPRNPFGHPARAIVQRYRDGGAAIFSTPEDGAIVIDTNGREAVAWTWGSRRRERLLPR